LTKAAIRLTKVKTKLEKPEQNRLRTENGDQSVQCSSAVLRLRLLITELIQEVDLIEGGHSISVEARFGQPIDCIDFYEEVERFEVALIKAALQRTAGHQSHAARFLNINATTLNAKIKQYKIQFLMEQNKRSGDEI
jgi:DNA-binding NtrC family response regulator